MTRRSILATGAGAVLGGLAGCVGSNGATASSPTEDPTPTATPDPTPDDPAYTVSMAPVGDVTFEAVPERWIAYDGGYADMAVALGQAETLTGIGYADRYYTYVYDEIDGLSVDATVDLASDGSLRITPERPLGGESVD